MRTANPHAPKGSPFPEPDRSILARRVRAIGERLALVALGVNRQTLGRALGGLTLYPGSIALLRQGLARLEILDSRNRAAERLASEPARARDEVSDRGSILAGNDPPTRSTTPAQGAEQ